jgi:hypothetical protein
LSTEKDLSPVQLVTDIVKNISKHVSTF